MAHDSTDSRPGGAWPTSMAPIANHMRSNLELMTSLNHIVARAAQSMAARQSAVLTEAIADITTLVRSAAPNPGDPTVTARAYAAYVEAMMQRGMAQLNFSVETIAEMSSSTLELARKRMSTDAPSEPEAPPPRHAPHRK